MLPLKTVRANYLNIGPVEVSELKSTAYADSSQKAFLGTWCSRIFRTFHGNLKHIILVLVLLASKMCCK